MEAGACSMNVKAVLPTDSAQNWESILHGVLPEKHGLKNSDVDAGIPYQKGNLYPSIYALLNGSNNVKMASFVSWEGINKGIIEYTVNAYKYAPITHENIIWRMWLYIKHYLFKAPVYDYTLVQRVVEYIRNPEN
jgi:hypothetical protein